MSLDDFGVITALKPIGGGWRYPQPNGGIIQRIPTIGSAAHCRALVKMVTEYRAANGIEMGDVEQDIADFIKKASPQNDRFKGHRVNTARPRPLTPLIHEVRQWIDNLAPERPRIVDQSEAIARAEICIKCPQNIAWKINNCADCNKEVEYRSQNLRGVIEFGLDDALRACRLHKMHLGAGVFIDVDHHPERSSEAPTQCWVKSPATSI